MNFQLTATKVRETRIGRTDRDAADPPGEKVCTQSLVAKFRVRGKIFRARPTLAVVQRHSVEGTARQKQTAPVAEWEMPYRSPQYDTRARQAPRHERSVQPGKRRRRDDRARKIIMNVRCI